MAAVTSFQAEKCRHLVDAHPASIHHLCSIAHLLLVTHTMSVSSLFSENPTSVELDGDVGYYNLLVRAVQRCDDVGQPSWSFIAQELRQVDAIDGSVMRMMLTHSQSSDALSSAAETQSAANMSLSVRKLLKQFPSVLPSSLSQFVVNPSALPVMHGQYRICLRKQNMLTKTNKHKH